MAGPSCAPSMADAKNLRPSPVLSRRSCNLVNLAPGLKARHVIAWGEAPGPRSEHTPKPCKRVFRNSKFEMLNLKDFSKEVRFYGLLILRERQLKLSGD